MDENYTKIDNRFLDEVMQTLKSSELACCMAIFRKTSGWGKKSAAVSVDAISKITGIKRRETIINALDTLKEKGIIQATKTAGKMTVYEFCYYLNQSLETSPKNRTSTEKRTSAENRTSTSTENGTSTSTENRTSSSIYKENERKEKEIEREGDYYLQNKKAIDRFISTVIQEHESIKSESAYRKKMIKQFIKGDDASIIEFQSWLPTYQCEELKAKYRRNSIVAVTDQGRFEGELLNVWINADGKPSFSLEEPINYETRNYNFNSIEGLEEFLSSGGSK